MKTLLVVLTGVLLVTSGCQPDSNANPEQADANTTSTGADANPAESPTASAQELEAQAGAEASAQVEWLTNLDAALEKAKSENKLVFVDFTGSDWCGWCIRLDEEIFSKPEFAQYAGKHLVPVKIDFPRRTKLPQAQQQANEALAKKYNIEGFPTLVVLDGSGQEVGRLGYMPGGPKAFIAKLEKVKASAASKS